MKRIITPIFASATLLAAVPALAATDSETDMKGVCNGALMPADTDQDGAVSQGEIEAFQNAVFEQLDANKDGSIDREEYVSCMKGARDAEQQRAAEGEESGTFDVGSWGDISENMEVTNDEYAQFAEEAWQSGDKAKQDAIARTDGETDSNAESFAHAAVQRFRAHDVNGDGIITQSEYETPARQAEYDDAALERRFNDKDADNSGGISPQEYGGAATWARGALGAQNTDETVDTADSADNSDSADSSDSAGEPVSVIRYYILSY